MTSFRDRFLTPKVARAIMSPLGIVLAGAAMAAGVVAGLPVAGAVALGAVAWAGRVLAAVPRAPRSARIDPFALRDPWRGFVKGALDAQSRFGRAVASTRPGPLRDRLTGIGDRVATGVSEVWHIATRAQGIDDALRQLDTKAARAELAEVERNAGAPWAQGSNLARTADALRAQVSSAERMAALVADARDRLRLLDARLDEAVARAVELSVGSGDDVGALSGDVDSVVGEMEALREALDETSAASAPGPAPVRRLRHGRGDAGPGQAQPGRA